MRRARERLPRRSPRRGRRLVRLRPAACCRLLRNAIKSETSPPRIVRAGSSLSGPTDVRANVGVTRGFHQVNQVCPRAFPRRMYKSRTEPRARLRAQLRAEWRSRSPLLSSFHFQAFQLQIAFLEPFRPLCREENGSAVLRGDGAEMRLSTPESKPRRARQPGRERLRGCKRASPEQSERAQRVSHASGAGRRSGAPALERALGSPERASKGASERAGGSGRLRAEGASASLAEASAEAGGAKPPVRANERSERATRAERGEAGSPRASVRGVRRGEAPRSKDEGLPRHRRRRRVQNPRTGCRAAHPHHWRAGRGAAPRSRRLRQGGRRQEHLDAASRGRSARPGASDRIPGRRLQRPHTGPDGRCPGGGVRSPAFAKGFGGASGSQKIALPRTRNGIAVFSMGSLDPGVGGARVRERGARRVPYVARHEGIRALRRDPRNPQWGTLESAHVGSAAGRRADRHYADLGPSARLR